MPDFKKQDGTIVTVHESRVQDFLQTFPDATQMPGKELPPQKEEQGAPVEENVAPNMDLNLVNGSLDYNNPKVRKQLGFTYGEEQQYLRNKTIPERIEFEQLQKTIDQTTGKQDQGQLTTEMPSYEDQYKNYIETKEENKKTRQKMMSITGLDPYEPKVDSATALELSNKLISNIKLTEENLKSSYEQSFQKIIASDEYINKHLMFDIFESQNQKIEDYKNKLSQEYDLTDPAQVDSANQKLESFISESINNSINSNKTYKNRIKTYQVALDQAFQNKYKEFKREELGIDDDSSFWEGAQKGYKQFQLSIDKTMLASQNEQILDLENKIADKSDDEIVSVGGTFMPRQGITVGAENKTVKQVKQDLYIKKNEILKNLDEIGKQEFDLQFFKEAEGYGLSDIAIMAGEQLIQLPVAALTFGVGVFAQEYGNAYFDTIYAKLEAEGKELTDKNFLAALEAGYGDPSIAATSAGIQSALEFGGASTIAKAVIGKPAQGFVRSIIKDGIRRYIKEGGLRAGGRTIAGAGLTEFLTESFQTLTSQIAKGTAAGELSKYINVEEIKKSAIQGGIVGTLFPLVGRAGKQTIRETTNAAKKIASLRDPESTTRILDNARKQVEQDIKDGKIIKADGEETLKAISDVDNANTKIAKNVKGKDREKAIDLLVEKKKLENRTANLDESFVNSINKRLEEIKAEMDEIAYRSELVEQIENTQKTFEKIKGGKINSVLKFIQAATPKEFLQKAKENGITDADITDAARVKDGITIINMEVAANIYNVATPGHEALHHGLYKTLFNQDGTTPVVALSNLLKDYLKTIDPGIFNEDSFVGRKMRMYEQDKTYTEQGRAEELFNVLSEVFNNPNLKAPNESFLIKIGDAIRRILQNLGWKQIKFESGKDVYNFIKDYSHTIRKGKTENAVTKALEKGIAISPEILKKSEPIEDIISQASKQVATSEKVTELYNQKGVQASMEIIELFDPILNKITNNYKGTPNFNFQELKDAIAYDPDRGLLGLIMKYKPESNVPLAAYINKYLPSRAIEFAQMQLGTQFELDVTEAKGVVAEEAIEEQIEVKEKPKVPFAQQLGITEEVNQKIKQSVIKTFGTRLPNTNSKDFKNALIKAYRIELKPTIAKLMGKQEKYESFLADNFKSIYDILPQTTINRRFKDFADPVLDENGKQLRERTAEGNKIFTKKKITKAEWLNYFIGRNVGRSTQGTRKTAVAEEIGVELAFDAATEAIKDPALMGKFKDIQELSGIGLAENFIDEIARQINRDNRSKASKGLTASEFSEFATELAVILKEDGQITDRFNNYRPKGFNDDQVKFLKDFVEDLYKKGLIKGSTFGGIVFEQALIKDLQKFGLPVLQDGGAGYDNNSPDIQIRRGDNDVLFIEAKESARARMGGGSARFDFTKPIGSQISLIWGRKEVSKAELPNGELLYAFLERFLPQIKQTLDFINAEEGTNYTQFPPKPAKIKEETYEKLKLQSFYQEYAAEEGVRVTPESIEAHYNNKNNFYIHIGKKGTYFLGQNPLNIENITRFNFDLNVQIRIGLSGKIDSEGKKYFGFRSEMKIAEPNKMPNSKFNIENEADAKILNEKLISKASKGLSKEFNKILEQSSGVKFTKQFSPVQARVMGKGKGKKFFIPYSADDFVGLLYATLGRKEIGDQQMEWYKENLLRPFSRGIQEYERAKQNALREWQILKKQAKEDVPGGLDKVNATGLTNQDAVRLYIWNKQGMEIPGVKGSAAFVNDNLKIVRKSPELKAFAEKLMALNPEGYPEPSKEWDSGDITTDIVSYINGVKRSEFLTEWKENVDIIFSDQNKEKLRALYGDSYIEALDDILHRMRTGTNRKFGVSKVERQFMDWTNNSVGAIMFFNARSAVLQTLSAVNFINFTDNNPINAAKALANFSQYIDDFTELFNSDFLKQRRSGLQTDVNADEIARAAKGAKNTARAVLSALLKFGFIPTQIADSFAIASGGATFYRNRIKTYMKEGMSEQDAKAKAFTDFQEIAEETQQSARPDRISLQQASSLGRLILAFGNTPMQYARLTKKATLDLINGRGDWKTNMSKIMYYSVIQNIIFSALQQGLFALLFDDEDDDKEKARLFRIGNSSLDTLLRGVGVYGAAAATVKNMIIKTVEESKNKRSDYTKIAIEATAISPPINSKLRKLISAGKTFTYKQSKEKVFTEGFSLENPAFLATGQIISALTNLPADRIVQKADHIYTAMQPETELWQSIALVLGWSEWDLNMIKKDLTQEDIEKKLRKIERILNKI